MLWQASIDLYSQSFATVLTVHVRILLAVVKAPYLFRQTISCALGTLGGWRSLVVVSHGKLAKVCLGIEHGHAKAYSSLITPRTHAICHFCSSQAHQAQHRTRNCAEPLVFGSAKVSPNYKVVGPNFEVKRPSAVCPLHFGPNYGENRTIKGMERQFRYLPHKAPQKSDLTVGSVDRLTFRRSGESFPAEWHWSRLSGTASDSALSAVLRVLNR
jgi:hypothetical protein